MQYANSLYTKKLEEIKLSLLKIAKNAKQTTYSELREIRKTFNVLSTMQITFSKTEIAEADEIKKLLRNLKETHPEICSKDEFVKSVDYQVRMSNSQYAETTFDRPNNSNDNMSINVLSSSVIHKPEDDVFLKPNRFNSFKGAKSTKVDAVKPSSKDRNMRGKPMSIPVADASECTELSEEEITSKIHQLRYWAMELRDALDKLE